MTRIRILVLLLLGVVSFHNNYAQQREEHVTITMDYLVSLPSTFERETDQKWPVLIFLHGRTDNPSLERVKQDFLTVFVSKYEDFPFIVVSPVSQNGRFWSVYLLNRMLDDFIKRYPIDEDRIYLTGHSMGGYGTWDWGYKNPERFAAMAPISGCPIEGYEKIAERLQDMPIWIFHGDEDELINVDCSKSAFNEIKHINQNAKLTIYPNTGHDTWEQPFVEDSVYKWFLVHKRTDNRP